MVGTPPNNKTGKKYIYIYTYIYMAGETNKI